MYLSQVNIKNFRRLHDVKISLDREISIFVGANNSGKTSVAEAINFFLSGSRDSASLHDISACKWCDIEACAIGDTALLPEMVLDLWFSVEEPDLYKVIDLLPNLDWQGSTVGLRIAFSPCDSSKTLETFKEKHGKAQAAAANIKLNEGDEPYVAPPKNLRDFLEENIRKEYEFRYYVLDEAKFNEVFEANSDYQPQELIKDRDRSGRDIVNSLIKVDFLQAQRHLSDNAGGNRAEDLSRHLSRYYKRNLDRHGDDHNAIRALDNSKDLFNQHLDQVFSETLQRLEKLGYPGLTNPRLTIKSALNPASIMNSHDGAQVYYDLNDGFTLPDKYNGLGFKNLIYMVVELLDLHSQWLAIEDKRPPLHLVFVEEPEAHLHAQLQQVFVKQILSILEEDDKGTNGFHSQLVLTTHSPHILYERGFRPIRYFRREEHGVNQKTHVLNLSEFHKANRQKVDSNASKSDFLERYLRLTHCDLFFADAVIFVEGSVERLLMPQMIDKVAQGLHSRYVTVLEIGGAFSHLFRPLIEFLGIPTLIITDLDSISGGLQPEDNAKDKEKITSGKACYPEEPECSTSNQMLIQWLPCRSKIVDLLALDSVNKTLSAGANGLGAVRVTYPCTVDLTLGDKKLPRAGRTLEVAFAFDNLEWTQLPENKDLKLHLRTPNGIEDIALRLHDRVHSDGFKKTDFALALLTKEPNDWNVPQYITEGLQWLEDTLGVKAPTLNEEHIVEQCS